MKTYKHKKDQHHTVSKSVRPAGYKSIFHIDHLPATIGVFAFFFVFSLSLLQISLSMMNVGLRSSQTAELEMFPLLTGDELVDVAFDPGTSDIELDGVLHPDVVIEPETSGNKIVAVNLFFEVPSGVEISATDELDGWIVMKRQYVDSDTYRFQAIVSGTTAPTSLTIPMTVTGVSEGLVEITLDEAQSIITGTDSSQSDTYDYGMGTFVSGQYNVLEPGPCYDFDCPDGNNCIECGDSCVNVSIEEDNCGSCGVSCVGNQQCQSGACFDPGSVNPCDSVASGFCGAGDTCQACSDYQCHNLSDEESNCGACGTVCSSGEICQEGSCVSTSSGNDDDDACNDTTPSQPKNLKAEAGPGVGEVTLSWNKSSNADHYDLFYGTTWPPKEKKSNIGNGSTTSYVLKSLDHAKAYYINVQAVNGCKKSNYAVNTSGGLGVGARPGQPVASGIGGGQNTGGNTGGSYQAAATATATPVPKATPDPTYVWKTVPDTDEKGAMDLAEDEYYSYDSDDDSDVEDKEEVIKRTDGTEVDKDAAAKTDEKESGFDLASMLKYWPLFLGLLLAMIVAAIIISIKRKQEELEYYEERLGEDDKILDGAKDEKQDKSGSSGGGSDPLVGNLN